MFDKLIRVLTYSLFWLYSLYEVLALLTAKD